MKNKLNGHHIFDGRTVVIATMHEKEKVIAPLLEKNLSANCFAVSGLNTDKFGTFSGEIERKKSPLQTARVKALAALELCDETLVVASEGSFGSHPSSIFVPANEEMVILIDTKLDLEIVGRHLTVKTNYNHRSIASMKDLEGFKTDIGYPEHGIILRATDANHNETIHKDFSSQNDLDSTVRTALRNELSLKAETDMRANQNPTRMLAIEQAVVDLVKNINSLCPECDTPGFVVQEVVAGLPCEQCERPTKSVKAYIHQCQKCEYLLERVKEGVPFEEAMYCDFCNP